MWTVIFISFYGPRKTATHKALFQGHSGNFLLTCVIHLIPHAFLNNFSLFWSYGGKVVCILRSDIDLARHFLITPLPKTFGSRPDQPLNFPLLLCRDVHVICLFVNC